jgi:hypothetical protein
MSIFHGERDLSRRFSASILAATVTDQHSHIDKPEPRWQALLAFLAIGGIYPGASAKPRLRADLVVANHHRGLARPDSG